MCYFYGWKLNDVLELSVDDFESFWQAITMIEAQDTLVRFTISDWPNITKNNRDKIHRKMHKDAYPKIYKKEQEQNTTADIFNQLAMVVNNGR